MTLTEFLLARIAEDETMAEEALDRGFGGWEHFADLGVNHEARSHIARHHPARVLAKCEAKRRIVEHAEALIEEAAEMDERAGFPSDAPDGTSQRTDAMHLLKLLALPYADHPDWREEWRP